MSETDALTVSERVWARDESLWGGPGVPEIGNRLGWLDIADRIMLMQRGRVTFEQHSAQTSVPELMDIVRREYRAMRANGTN